VTEILANAILILVKTATRQILHAKSDAATAAIIANVSHATEIHANAVLTITAAHKNLPVYVDPKIPPVATAAEKIASAMSLAKINASAKQIKNPAIKKLFARV